MVQIDEIGCKIIYQPIAYVETRRPSGDARSDAGVSEDRFDDRQSPTEVNPPAALAQISRLYTDLIPIVRLRGSKIFLNNEDAKSTKIQLDKVDHTQFVIVRVSFLVRL